MKTGYRDEKSLEITINFVLLVLICFIIGAVQLKVSGDLKNFPSTAPDAFVKMKDVYRIGFTILSAVLFLKLPRKGNGLSAFFYCAMFILFSAVPYFTENSYKILAANSNIDFLKVDAVFKYLNIVFVGCMFSVFSVVSDSSYLTKRVIPLSASLVSTLVISIVSLGAIGRGFESLSNIHKILILALQPVLCSVLGFSLAFFEDLEIRKEAVYRGLKEPKSSRFKVSAVMVAVSLISWLLPYALGLSVSANNLTVLNLLNLSFLFGGVFCVPAMILGSKFLLESIVGDESVKKNEIFSKKKFDIKEGVFK